MIHFTEGDAQMLAHVVDVIGDRMRHESDGYTEQDEATMTKLEELAKAGAAVTMTGEQQDHRTEMDLFRQIVEAELKNWVPDASQRLLFRAGAALGIPHPNPAYARRPDCGKDRISHALYPNWAAGVYVLSCVSCFRLFRH